jgi:hypothetical protein
MTVIRLKIENAQSRHPNLDIKVPMTQQVITVSAAELGARHIAYINQGVIQQYIRWSMFYYMTAELAIKPIAADEREWQAVLHQPD